MLGRQDIFEHFAAQIRSGRVAVGSKLPTEKQISEQFGVSRSTVQAAMTRLAEVGLVRRYAGRGTFACRGDSDMRMKVDLDIHNIQSFESEIAVRGDTVSYRLLSFAVTQPSERAASRLDLAPQTEVYALHRSRHIGADCIGLEMRYFAPDLPMDLPMSALLSKGLHAILRDDLGVVIGRIDAALRAACATKEEAQALDLDPGAPLLVRSHTLYGIDERPLVHGESSYVEPFSFRYSATVREENE